MVNTVLMVVHVFVALGIIGLVLIQHGKGADAGAAFGGGASGGASGSVFGAQGSTTFLSRSTAVLATVFFVTSLSMAYLAQGPKQQESLVDQAPEKEKIEAPVSEIPEMPATQGNVSELPMAPVEPDAGSKPQSSSPATESTEIPAVPPKEEAPAP